MKKFTLLVLSCLLLLFVVTLADAGPFRIFGRFRGNDSCANGSCQTPGTSQSSTPNCPNGVCEVPGTKPTFETVALVAARQLDAKSFAGSLQRNLTGKANTPHERHLLNILNSPDSPRRDRQIQRMEHTARAALGLSMTAAIDWTAIDWPSVFQMLLQMLIKLLPLLLGL